MRIVFMGTPEFAAASLERLYNDGHDVAGVITQPDKPNKRGKAVSYSPVKKIALSHNTPLYQPVSPGDSLFLGELYKLKCDIIVVTAYGRLLPPVILAMPPMGCINIHGSLLPKYRGAAPVQRAVLNGETETGVTSMYMAEEIDSGDILLSEKTKIGENETAEELYARLSILGAGLLSKTLTGLQRGVIVRSPQKSDEATYAPALSKDMAPVDWTRSAVQIKRAVLGLTPWPVASASLGGTDFKLHTVEICEAELCDANEDSADYFQPGHIISADRRGIKVACADGAILIKELQAPGGKRMSAADYLRGRPNFLNRGV